jgi:hypothetical protein
MGRRPTLVAGMKAAADRVAAAPPPPMPAELVAPAKPARSRELTDGGATTAVHLPREDLALLRRVSVERANRQGGRPSVSNILRELIEQHRAELEAEAER